MAARRDNNGLASLPYVSRVVQPTLAMSYGLLLDESTLIAVNALGLLMSAFFLGSYALNAANMYRETLRRELTLAALFLALVYIYVNSLGDEDERINAVGYVLCATSLVMFAAPLAEFAKVVRTRDTSSVSFPFAVTSTLCALSWTLFGVVLNDNFVMVPNLLGLMLSFAQLSLFAVYGFGDDSNLLPR